MLIVYSIILNALVVAKLWRLREAGQTIPTINWVLAGCMGLLVFAIFYGGLYVSLSSVRFLEFKAAKLYLADRGQITRNRVIEWSLSPSSFVPDCFRVEIVYKFGFGKRRWSMLVDDKNQIAQLNKVLEEIVPLTVASD